MPLILSEAEVDRLQEISENKDFITLEYLNDISNKLTKFIFENFFNGDTGDATLLVEAKKKLDILNQTLALPYKLATLKAKFVGEPITNLEIENLNEAVFSFVYGGCMVFAIDETDEDGKPIINIYNAEQYVNEGKIEKLLTYLKNEKGEKYVFVKEFEDGTGMIENKLYKISNGVSGLNGEDVGLSKLSATGDFEEVDNFETELPLLFIEHDFKIQSPLYGTPSLNFIKPMIRAIDIELVNMKDQFLKHLSAKMAIQGIDAAQMPKDDDGNILMREAEAIFLQNGVNKPEYITNKNELLSDVIKMLDKYIATATTNLSVPLELVGLSGQVGTESTESKLLRYSDFVKDIEFIRSKISNAFEKIYDTIMDIYPNYFEGDKEKDFVCKWRKVMPQDGLKLAQELSVAKLGGFVSQRTAVKEYTGLEGEELEDELKQIEIEAAKSLDNTSLF